MKIEEERDRREIMGWWHERVEWDITRVNSFQLLITTTTQTSIMNRSQFCLLALLLVTTNNVLTSSGNQIILSSVRQFTIYELWQTKIFSDRTNMFYRNQNIWITSIFEYYFKGWQLLFYPVTLHRLYSKRNLRSRSSAEQEQEQGYFGFGRPSVAEESSSSSVPMKKKAGFFERFWGGKNKYTRGKSSFGKNKFDQQTLYFNLLQDLSSLVNTRSWMKRRNQHQQSHEQTIIIHIYQIKFILF